MRQKAVNKACLIECMDRQGRWSFWAGKVILSERILSYRVLQAQATTRTATVSRTNIHIRQEKIMLVGLFFSTFLHRRSKEQHLISSANAIEIVNLCELKMPRNSSVKAKNVNWAYSMHVLDGCMLYVDVRRAKSGQNARLFRVSPANSYAALFFWLPQSFPRFSHQWGRDVLR
jgi:hypothetical protein